MDAPLLVNLLTQGNVDLNLSVLAWRDGEPLGLILIARQGWTSRIAGMGVIPEAQGQQVGWALLQHAIAQASERGDRFLELEAFEQNTRAVKLYEKGGFRILRRLYGWTLTAGGSEADHAPLIACDPLEVARVIMAHGAPDLPWQVSGTAIARIGAPSRAYQLENAFAVISDPSRETIALRALFVTPDHQRQGQGRRLIRALWAEFPGKQWQIPQLCPQEFSGFFESLGFTRQSASGTNAPDFRPRRRYGGVRCRDRIPAKICCIRRSLNDPMYAPN
ncbi:MAG: GNAT family N-acetyltransferase [Anaerolineae bacterium]